MNYGIIVGRFQTDELTPTHKYLIKHVTSQSDKYIIFIGTSPLRSSYNNPLNFDLRWIMIYDFLLDDEVGLSPIFKKWVGTEEIKDVFNINIWSKNLDNKISELTTENDNIILYGGRDSFIENYNGKYPTKRIKEVKSQIISSTQVRQQIHKMKDVFGENGKEFRRGVIWSTGNQFPSVLATVDICIFDPKNQSILLAKKPSDTKYRFVGGFSDVNDDSYEAAAIREVKEETGLSVDDITYIGSCKIDDIRFKKELNKIKTLFFITVYNGGIAKTNDDISEVKWFKISEIKEKDIIDVHKPLYIMFENSLLYKKLLTFSKMVV